MFDPLQQIPSEMNTAALPDSALQLPADRLVQAEVGITDNDLTPVRPKAHQGMVTAALRSVFAQETAAEILSRWDDLLR